MPHQFNLKCIAQICTAYVLHVKAAMSFCCHLDVLYIEYFTVRVCNRYCLFSLVIPVFIDSPDIIAGSFFFLWLRVYLQSVSLQSIHKASEIVSNKNVVQFT